MKNDMIEILLATYNGEKYLREQLDSLINQTYENIRILIRDDGSIDQTEKIIDEYMKEYPDKVYRVIDNIKCGSAVSNFMELTKSATADYIMYCDQDDYWFPEKVEISLKWMKRIEGETGKTCPILVFGDYEQVNEKLEKIECKGFANQIDGYHLELNRLLVQNYVTGCLMMINKPLYLLMGEYRKEILMHDWWAALIASSMGIIYHFPQKLMYYRQHNDNVVGAVNVKSWKYRIEKFLDKKTKYMKNLYERQAACFLNCYFFDLKEDERIQMQNFISISKNRNKMKRIYLLNKGKFLKSDFIRILGQYWYV